MSVETTPRSAVSLRTTAIAGLAAFVFLAGGQGLQQIGGGEPPFDAQAADIADFFANRNQDLFPIGTYLSVLSLLALLWFFGGLHALVKQDWRSMIAMASGIVFVGATFTAGWEPAAFRVSEGVDPQIARLAFDMGNMGFASAWAALGSFSVAFGLAVHATGELPRWLGWWSIVTGALLLPAKAVWTTQFWLVGFGVFWIWAITACVLMLRRAGAAKGAQERMAATESEDDQ